jgi:hypothetical protein
MSPLHMEFEPFRRHYTVSELDALLAKAERLLAVERLILELDDGISDRSALAVRLGRETVRLTAFMSSREMAIALTAMALLPEIWDYDRASSARVSAERHAARVRKTNAGRFGKRGVRS